MITKYFKGVQSLEDLKNKFKSLIKENHPDVGGDVEVMKIINTEYDVLFPILKKRDNITTYETSHSTRSEFYTEYGYKGSRYNSSMNGTNVSKIMRKFVKEYYPECKFSITSSYTSINISLMESPYQIFIDPTMKSNSVNHYYIDTQEHITPVAKAIFHHIYNELLHYHMDDTDSMIDFFRTNFYIHFGVGKWDKPYVQNNKKMKNEINVLTEIIPLNNVIISIVFDSNTELYKVIVLDSDSGLLTEKLCDDFVEAKYYFNQLIDEYIDFKITLKIA